MVKMRFRVKKHIRVSQNMKGKMKADERSTDRGNEENAMNELTRRLSVLDTWDLPSTEPRLLPTDWFSECGTLLSLTVDILMI